MVVDLNLCIFSNFAPISKSALPSNVALVPRTTLLARSILPFRFLIIWIRAKVRFTWLIVIPSLRVVTFLFFLVGSTIVYLREKLRCKVLCVYFYWLPFPSIVLIFPLSSTNSSKFSCVFYIIPSLFPLWNLDTSNFDALPSSLLDSK